ncbi:MAG: hypothetical protein ISS77_07400 [Phycisphaerae bacterium]|nr:hypothetical protein [Phycisphaerae bacterium]
MKLGPKDKKYQILITGQELEELKKLTWSMAEAFGLDTRIDKYLGKRPIGFYPWDLDCLDDAISMALDDEDEYPDKTSDGYETLKHLYVKIHKLHKKAYKDE